MVYKQQFILSSDFSQQLWAIKSHSWVQLHSCSWTNHQWKPKLPDLRSAKLLQLFAAHTTETFEWFSLHICLPHTYHIKHHHPFHFFVSACLWTIINQVSLLMIFELVKAMLALYILLSLEGWISVQIISSFLPIWLVLVVYFHQIYSFHMPTICSSLNTWEFFIEKLG